MIQDWIPLPQVQPSTDVSLINATVMQQQDQEARVVFTFHNPDGLSIPAVRVRWLDTEVKTQYMLDNLWRVEAVVTPARQNPGYYSEYNVTGFTVDYGANQLATVTYEEKEYRKAELMERR